MSEQTIPLELLFGHLSVSSYRKILPNGDVEFWGQTKDYNGSGELVRDDHYCVAVMEMSPQK